MRRSILVLLTAASVCGIASAQTFFLRGGFNGWDTSIMLTDNGNGTYSGQATGLVPGTDYEYKIAEEAWGGIEAPGLGLNARSRSNDAGKVEVIFFNNPTPADGWLPDTYRIGLLNLTFNGQPKNYVLIGDFPESNWSGTGLPMDKDPLTGIFTRKMTLNAGTLYSSKFAGETMDGFGVDWSFNVGEGFGCNGNNITFTPDVSGDYLYQLDVAHGRYRIIPATGPAISGKVTLASFAGAVAGTKITVEVYDAGSSTLKSTTTTTLDGNGLYSAATALGAGNYDVRIKSRSFLAKRVTGVAFSAGGATGVDATLLGGDIDGDNVVTVFDYNALSSSFDKTSDDADWTTEVGGIMPKDSDLDGDGAVTVFDYNILSANFDLSGDE